MPCPQLLLFPGTSLGSQMELPEHGQREEKDGIRKSMRKELNQGTIGPSLVEPAWMKNVGGHTGFTPPML